MRIADTVRSYPGAVGQAGLTVTLKLDADDSTLATDTTDADGRFSFDYQGHPGPWYWTVTDVSLTPDATRTRSSRSYGSGGAYSLYELIYALRILGEGVIRGYEGELAVTYDAAGLDLDVAKGATAIKGLVASFPAVTDYAITSTRDATHPRQCYLVVETVGAGEATEGKTRLIDVCGTAAASPALPALTQTEALYQLPLATFRLPNTSSTTLTQVTDVRTYCLDRNPSVTSTVTRNDPTSELTTTSTAGANATGLTTSLTLLDGVIYDVEARAWLNMKVTAGNTAYMGVYLNDTPNMSEFMNTQSTSYVGVGNVHYLGSVTGTGAAISCGVRIKVSAGTMTYNVGFLQVIARPRS